VLKDGNEQAWLHGTRSQKILWYWKTFNQEILRNIQRYSYLQVKYEDFFDPIKGREQPIKVINFIGLPLPDKSSLEKALSARRNSSKHMSFL
jgi:hypothetical protein